MPDVAQATPDIWVMVAVAVVGADQVVAAADQEAVAVGADEIDPIPPWRHARGGRSKVRINFLVHYNGDGTHQKYGSPFVNSCIVTYYTCNH